MSCGGDACPALEEEQACNFQACTSTPHVIALGTDGWCGHAEGVHQDVPGCGRVCSDVTHRGVKNTDTWAPIAEVPCSACPAAQWPGCVKLCDETENFEVDGACCPAARTQWDSSYSTAVACCDSDIVRADGQCGPIAPPAPVADPSTPAPVAKCPVQLVSAQKFATTVKAKGKGKKMKAANVDALSGDCETLCADEAKSTFWYLSKIKKGKQGSCLCLTGDYKSLKKNKKTVKGAAGGLTEAARTQVTAALNASRRRRRRGRGRGRRN